MDGEILEPHAGPMIEALRDLGYTLEAAVADIIDNSISAKGRNVSIRFGWDQSEPWLAITDDGSGMSQSTLLKAMRPGSRNPREPRQPSDLGRFGLGLKTASFSQCRRLTVVTRCDGVTTARCWDLDEVNKSNTWLLIILSEEAIRLLPDIENLPNRGTYVLWQKIDRLDFGEYSSSSHKILNERISLVRKHLSLVFHRYLMGEAKLPKILIKINNLPVEPFDPFNAKNPATQHLPEERVGQGNESVVLQPFILPHHSKVSSTEYEQLAGADGYLKGQGFYIYRNSRLIIHGTWFRLARQEEITKLARVKVDIPNTLDHLWNIDVRKSHAFPPAAIKLRMRQIVERIRAAAKRPYTHRGIIIENRASAPVWNRKAYNDRIVYEIDTKHQLISKFIQDLNDSQRLSMRAILKMISTSFPAALFYSDIAENPDLVEKKTVDPELFAELANLVRKQNIEMDPSQLRDIFLSIEPFASHPEKVESFLASIKN